MGAAAKVIKETADAAGVGVSWRTSFAMERHRVAIAPAEDGRVALTITHEHQRSPSAPWTADRAACHPMSPAQARILAQLLVLAADRAEAESAEPPRG